MPLLPTILADLPLGKPQRTHLAGLLQQQAGRAAPRTATWPASAPAAPTRTAGRRAGDSTFLPKSGRKLPGTGWRWHNGEGRVAWGQQCELLSALDLDEHCAYPVHGCRQPSSAPRSRRRGALRPAAAGRGGGHAGPARRHMR